MSWRLKGSRTLYINLRCKSFTFAKIVKLRTFWLNKMFLKLHAPTAGIKHFSGSGNNSALRGRHFVDDISHTFIWMKVFIFSLKFVPKRSIEKQVSICSDNGLVPNRQQVIIWTSDGLARWLTPYIVTLQWRHNERIGVSNHHLTIVYSTVYSRRRTKKTSKLRVTGLCVGIHRWIPHTKGQ